MREEGLSEIFDLGGGVQANEKTYLRPVYRRGGSWNCSKPHSPNIGTDLEINGHFPEYDVIRGGSVGGGVT